MNAIYRRKPLRYLHYISLFVFLVFTVSSSYLLFFNEHKHEHESVEESMEKEQEHDNIIKKYEKYRNETYPIVASISSSSSSSNSTTTMADQIDRNTMIKIHRHLDVIRSTEGENKINVLIHGYDELLETAKGYYLRNQENESESENEKMVKIQLEVNDKETRKLRVLPQPRSLSKSSYFGSNGVPNYPTISFFDCYRNLEGSYMTMDHLENRYPTLVEVISIGDSYLKSVGQGGHDMKVLKLTNKEKEVEGGKSPMFIICAIHAREISTAEACARFAEYMLGNYEVNADVTWILDFVEIHMILQANPDGREDEEQYLHYRRKNMNRNRPSRRCSGSSYGTDLNRNFPHSAWGTTGVSNYKCSDVFPGVSAGSEIETQNIVNYIETVLPPGTNNQKDPDTNAYLSDSTKGVLIDVHSYWQAIFWPWAYDENIDAPNDVDLEAFAKKVASTASPVYVADNEVYPTSGDTTDWAHESTGVAALTIEIGTEFYQDCESSEDFIFDNARKMLLYGARVSMAPYELPKGPDLTSLSCSCYKDDDNNNNNLNSNSNSTTTTSTPLILVVDVTASDSQYALDFHTGQNRISSIDLYLDHHPYDKEEEQEESLPNVYATMGNGLREFTLSTESTSLIIPIPNITSSSDETAVGRHTIFIQASDDKETKGPVYASYLTISPSGQCECDDVNKI